jgi:hypothetical protein
VPASVNPALFNSGSRSIAAGDLVYDTHTVRVGVGSLATTGMLNGGADFGPDTSTAGVLTQTGGLAEATTAVFAAGGGSVYITGGIGNAITVLTPLTFLNTVQYIGDGVALKAGPGLLNPFTTDTTNAYWSGNVSNLTLDGNNVPGTTVFTVLSAKIGTFTDLIIQNAASSNIALTGSPFTYTNGTTLPQTLQLVGGTVSAVSSNGVAGAPTGTQVYTILPGNTLVVTYTVAPTLTLCGVGLLLTVSSTITPHGSLGRECGSNIFNQIYVTACSVGMVWSGLPTGPIEVTNNGFFDFAQDPLGVVGVGVAAIVSANNNDTQFMVRCKLALGLKANMWGIALNTFSPNTDAVTYQNHWYDVSVDANNVAGQVGLAWAKSTSGLPNLCDHFVSGPSFPLNVMLINDTSKCRINDQQGKKTWLRGALGSSGDAFAAPPGGYPGNGGTFTNNDVFPVLLNIQGGTISAITMNGQSTGIVTPPMMWYLKPGDTLLFASTVAPTTFKTCCTE